MPERQESYLEFPTEFPLKCIGGGEGCRRVEEIASGREIPAPHALVQTGEQSVELGGSPSRLLLLDHAFDQWLELRRRRIHLAHPRQKTERRVELMVPQCRTRLRQQCGDALLFFDPLPLRPLPFFDFEQGATQLA